VISTCIARSSMWEVPMTFWHSVCRLLVAKNMILSCCWNHRDIFLQMGWLHSGRGTTNSHCGAFFSFFFSLKNHANNSKFHYCFLSYWYFNFGFYSFDFYFLCLFVKVLFVFNFIIQSLFMIYYFLQFSPYSFDL
jgi:hypothetical protein